MVLSSLTSGVREVLSSFPTVWASSGAFLVLIQAGFAVDPPTASHLVWTVGHMKADLTDQLVRWCVHKTAVISISIGSHLLYLKTVTNINCLLPIYFKHYHHYVA